MNEPQVHPVLCDHSLGSMFMGYHKAETPIHSHNATSIDGEMSNILAACKENLCEVLLL